jgi:hypothetical protein
MTQASTYVFLNDLSERLRRGDSLEAALAHANSLSSQSQMAIEQAQSVLSRLRAFNRDHQAGLSPDDGA